MGLWTVCGIFWGGLDIVQHIRERKHSRVSSGLDLVDLVS